MRASIGAGAGFALVVALLGLLRLARGEAASIDLGIYAQLTWSAGGGDPGSSVQQAPGLAVHWAPILWLLGPLCRLASPAAVLLLAQALALGALGPLLFGCLRGALGERRALLASCAALLYPPLWSAALFDFHPEALGLPVALLLARALEERRARRALALALALGLLFHEIWPLALMGLAAQELVRRRGPERRLGGGLLGIGLALFALESLWLLPALRGDALRVDAVLYAHLGQGPLQVALSPLLRPAAFWGHLLTARHLAWAAGLLLPLLCLPLLRPARLLPALPVLLVHALSSRENQQSLAFHYHLPAIPWLLLAAGEALAPAPGGGEAGWRARLRAWSGAPARALTASPGLGALLLLAPLLGLLGAPQPRGELARCLAPADPQAAARLELLARVPRSAAAAATLDGLAPLAARPRLSNLGAALRGTKDWSRVPYAPPPDEAFLWVDAADAASFWRDPLPQAQRGLAAALAGRWRALAGAGGRAVLGCAEGVLLLGPATGAAPVPALEELPAGAPVGARLIACAREPRLDGPHALGHRLELETAGGDALWLAVEYLDPGGAALRRAAWPAEYRLLAWRGAPTRARLPLGLLRLGARARLQLCDERGRPQGAPLELELR